MRCVPEHRCVVSREHGREQVHGRPRGVTPTARSPSRPLCTCCVRVLPVDRAAIGVIGPSATWESMAASDASATLFQAQQVLAGEGPAFDALVAADPYWPTTVERVRSLAGLRSRRLAPTPAAHCSPSRCRSARSRSASSTCTAPSRTSPEAPEVADVLAVADIVTHGAADPERAHPRRTASALRPGGRRRRRRAKFIRPPGWLSLNCLCHPRVAYLRLRAYAFATERPLHDIARAVIDRQLRFDDENGS